MSDKLGTNVFDTIEELRSYQAKKQKLNAILQAMTPAARQEWFELNSGNIDDILESIS